MPKKSNPPSPPVGEITVEKALATIVRARRLELGLSQEQLQGDDQLTQSYISKIELAKREIGLLGFIVLARRLRIEPDQLLRQVLDAVEKG